MRAGRVSLDFSTSNGRQPALSWMNNRLTRAKWGYRRPFVIKWGARNWLAHVPPKSPTPLPADSYQVRPFPTWAEAYAHAYASADKCAVCGNCFHDHGGWNHAYTNSETLRIPDSRGCPTCEGMLAGQCWDCGRKASYRPAAEPYSPAIGCSNCLSPAGMGHEQGCRPGLPCSFDTGLCACDKRPGCTAT